MPAHVHRSRSPVSLSTDAVLDVQVLISPALPVVRLAGELDLASLHQLADALQCLTASTCPAELVVLDLSRVTFCDVAGLRAIDACAAALGAMGKEIVLHEPSPPVTRLIALRRRVETSG